MGWPRCLGAGEKPLLYPVTEAGSGSVQEKERAYLTAIIEKLNTLFDGDLTDDDQLVYVTGVIKGKLLESKLLVQQAVNNTKEQFATSPDLRPELLNAVMDDLALEGALARARAVTAHVTRLGVACIGPAIMAGR